MSDSISLNTIMTSGSTASGAPAKDDPEKIKTAARQFEALMIEQMLKSARESGSGGWMGSSGADAGAPLGDMAEQSFAQVLAANGGLGLAKLIISGLSRQQPSGGPGR